MVEKKPFHKKHQCIKMENAIEGAQYAFTFNPIDARNNATLNKDMLKNEIQAEKTLINHIDVWKQYLKRLRYCSFVVYPELSPDGRLHFHGYITFKNVLMFYYHDLHILNDYSYEIDTIGDTEQDKQKYATYITKQQIFWIALLEKYAMPYEIKKP